MATTIVSTTLTRNKTALNLPALRVNGSAVPVVAYRERSGVTARTTVVITAMKQGARTSLALQLNSYVIMVAAYQLHGNVTPKTTVGTVPMKAIFVQKKRVPISNLLAQDLVTVFRRRGCAMATTTVSIIKTKKVVRQLRVHRHSSNVPTSGSAYRRRTSATEYWTATMAVMSSVVLHWLLISVTPKNNFVAKSRVYVYQKRGTVTELPTATMIQMNRKLVDKFLASRTILNVTIHNVYLRHISVMAGMIAVMDLMKTIDLLAEHHHSNACQVNGNVLIQQIAVLI